VVVVVVVVLVMMKMMMTTQMIVHFDLTFERNLNTMKSLTTLQ
jgi:hypothetical protein